MLPFPGKFLDFHPPKFLMTFSPLFYTNSPAFYILYVYFVSPYFDHNAFMHVLDAPDCTVSLIKEVVGTSLLTLIDPTSSVSPYVPVVFTLHPSRQDVLNG